jgi:hypothetical protein
MKKITALTIIGMCSITIYSTPTWMWIGRFNELSCNTNCGAILYNAMAQYNTFFNAAAENHPSGPAPVENEKVLGWDVTWSTVKQCSTSSSDFLFFQAHGLEDAPAMSAVSDDKQTCYFWQPGSMCLGQYTYGTRWAYFQSCKLCRWTSNFWENWNGAFHGIQCVMGFGNSFYGDNSHFTETLNKFWKRWTGYNGTPGIPQKSVADAHFWSCFYEMYQNGYEITPVTISSNRVCTNHAYLDDTYNNATSEAGYWEAFTYWYDELIP